MKRCLKCVPLLAATCAALSAAALAPFPQWSEPRRITEGPHEHLLANYFAIDAWSPDHRYMLVLETDLNGRLPEANERCTLGVVDRADSNRFIPVTTTACWNFQEAAMAHWIDDDTFLFNDFRDGKFVTVVMNWRTKAERILPMPVSAVSEDRTWAVSINYARLSLTRPDYGYAGDGQDARASSIWPEDDGLWTMNLKTGECKLILSVAQGRSLMPDLKPIDEKTVPKTSTVTRQGLAYYCHTVISKDGAKIFFLARSVDWFDKTIHKASRWQTTSFTINRDGTELRRCFKDNWAGSHFNWAPDGSHKMLVTAVWDGHKKQKGESYAWSPVEFTVGEEEKVRRIGAGVLDWDWHCIYSPDGKFMSGDTYWTRNYERSWVLTRLEDGMSMPMGAFYVPPEYRGGYWRCDLHARYRPDGRQIAFNSVHEGSRQVYVRDIGPARTDVSLAGAGWTADGDAVTVPHTWNAEDAADGIGRAPDWSRVGYSAGATSYVRKAVSYRRALPNPQKGRRQFVKCLGASTKAEVKVNGRTIGRHVGAFTAFCFEATEALKPSGNELEIIVDNTFDPDNQPIHADFSVYGGLYRDVRWIETDKVCIDPVTDGACGVVLEPNPDTGEVVARVSVLGGTNEVQRFSFGKPQLWSPEHPKLYTANVVVRQKGSWDEVPVRFGFRKVEFRDDGLYLNGGKYRIRGVCRHQDREGKGWAVSDADEDEDVMLMKSMGATGVRTSHYPQSPHFYDQCDEKGLLVWTEVPNVNGLTFTEKARENELTMAREMVAQHRNHPSIFVWGLFNEIYNQAIMTEAPEPRLRALADYVRSLDPSRPVSGASNGTGEKRKMLNTIPDQLGLNLYPGWYGKSSDRMGEVLDNAFAESGRCVAAVTEYGGGGCIGQHADPLKFRPKPAGPFHPEEYQAYHHVENYRAIAKDDRLWGSFLWVMFDLGSDARQEGQFMGRNDKGLVTWDRKNFKDAYYFYRANWTDTPTLRLVGARMTSVTNDTATVLGFSNVGDVTLKVNGATVGTLPPDEVKSVMWKDVPLTPGANRIELTAGGRTSAAVWHR